MAFYKAVTGYATQPHLDSSLRWNDILGLILRQASYLWKGYASLAG